MFWLADEDFPLPSVQALRSAGHDVVAVREAAPGIADTEVLARAAAEERIMLTFDRDHGELVFRRRLRPPPGVVYFRFIPADPREPARVLLSLLRTPGLELVGWYTVVGRSRHRQRPMPGRDAVPEHTA